MNKNKLVEFFDHLDDNDEVDTSSHKRVSQRRQSKKQESETRLFIRAQEISSGFTFTYKAARFEEAWLLDSLVDFVENEWISDVLRKVKGGKEASVYVCKAGPEIQDKDWVAVKVYRPRMLRNLKNDSQYRVGRMELDQNGHRVKGDRVYRAIKKRTEFGEEIRHQSWIAYEFTTLKTLHEAGADVPKPYAMEKNSILMDFIGDELNSAPALASIRLDRTEAKDIFERVVENIEILLSCNRIHGDLSAYNILYLDGKISLIDFPQVVAPQENPQAWDIFLRDVTRVCDYFIAQGVEVHARALAEKIWSSHGYKIIHEIHPEHLDAENSEDRRLWKKQNKS